MPSQKSPHSHGAGDGLASPVPPVDDDVIDEADPAEPENEAENGDEVENDHGTEEDPNHKAWWPGGTGIFSRCFLLPPVCGFYKVGGLEFYGFQTEMKHTGCIQ